jgi:predicted transcriptional regulator
MGAMVRDFLDRVFDGAADNLLVHLARDNKLTPKQRRIVEQLIEEVDER